MAAMTPQPDYHDWPTKAECAKLLGCSAATLERMAKAGKLEVRYREVPKRRPEAIYNPTEIDRLIGERNPPFVAPPGSAMMLNNPGNVSADAVREALLSLPLLVRDRDGAAAPEAASTPRVALSSKLYLTIDEAVEYSGLPASYLHRMIRGGGLLHVKADRWLRISRKSLERLDQ